MTDTKRILVIDDEEIVRISCRRTLEPRGFHVDTAADCAMGLELLDQNTYDVVLTDLKMPTMDGLEFATNISGKYPDMKIILITGYSTIDTAETAKEYGLDHYMEKPFTPSDLLDAIDEVLAEDSEKGPQAP